MPIDDQERVGIADLLTQEQNIPILVQVARSITKNVCDIANTQEALDYIYTHIDNSQTLLAKRHITKEVLFKYLHNKKIPLNVDFTKGVLVKKVIEYWHTSPAVIEEKSSQAREIADRIPTIVQEKCVQGAELQCVESSFPIHLLARKFSEWFFENYNKDTLKLEDFWSDAQLLLRIAANDGVSEQECLDASSLIDTLMNTKKQFGFFFNPNLTHAGVQGRINQHGLVLVLVCGTLHTPQSCVGIFECSFGLLRDPFAENNWKTKAVQFMLRSQCAPRTPLLADSDTLQEALSLPVPLGELS